MTEVQTADAGRLLPLNAFLLRPGASPATAFGPGIQADLSWYVWNSTSLESFDLDATLLQASAHGDVLVAVTTRSSAPPPWQLFFRDVLGVAGFGALRQTLGAAVFCAVEDSHDGTLRWIAYSFGAASQAIRRRAVEARFGLIVALNRISAAQADIDDPRLRGMLRQASYRAAGPYTFNAGYRAARDTPLDSFRIDRLMDLLSAAGGRTGSDDDPGQVFGARSLRLRESVSAVDDLVALASEALRDFHAENYRTDFGFIDHMVPVYDDDLENELRRQLLVGVLSGSENVDVLLPDDLVAFEDERVIHYIVRPGQPASQASDRVLTMDMVASMLADADLEALDKELRFADADRTVVARTSIIDCLAGELRIDGRRYVVFDGDFYRVDADLLQRVDAAVAVIPIVDIDLPCYAGGPESEWNSAVAANNPERFVLLDARLIRLSGASPFEACDLLDMAGALIHAKRKGRSSGMSYLFLQAERSCELLSDVEEARELLKIEIMSATDEASVDPTRALDIAHALSSPRHGVSVILALLGDWDRRTLINLPLLSKLALVSAIERIRRFGYSPAVALVGLCSRALRPTG